MSADHSKIPFTVKQIEIAHQQVKSGADFPAYIDQIIDMGVRSFETFVTDSHTRYRGENGYQVDSEPQYNPLPIAQLSDPEAFKAFLKAHQLGNSDYLSFCRQCAQTGIYKWIVSIKDRTCSYYDRQGNVLLVETIPS